MTDTPISYTKEYHRQKSQEFYLKAKENCKYSAYLEKKNNKYKEDPDFKERMRKYNRERYTKKKLEFQTMKSQVEQQAIQV